LALYLCQISMATSRADGRHHSARMIKTFSMPVKRPAEESVPGPFRALVQCTTAARPFGAQTRGSAAFHTIN
jgi:hypothetical protein